MECNEAENKFEPFLLGALDAEEMSAVDRHLDFCRECSRQLRADDDAVIHLAYSVPQVKAPDHIRHQILESIVPRKAPMPVQAPVKGRRTFIPAWGRRLAVHWAMAAASFLVAAGVAGGIWFNGKLDQADEEKQLLSAEIDRVVEVERRAKDLAERQRYLITMIGDPGVEVSLLSATGRSENSRGLVVSKSGEAPVLAVLDLPPLADNKYDVWLVKDVVWHRAGSFTVDSTGYGLTEITMTAPISNFDAIVITTRRDVTDPEPAEVLVGDL